MNKQCRSFSAEISARTNADADGFIADRHISEMFVARDLVLQFGEIRIRQEGYKIHSGGFQPGDNRFYRFALHRCFLPVFTASNLSPAVPGGLSAQSSNRRFCPGAEPP